MWAPINTERRPIIAFASELTSCPDALATGLRAGLFFDLQLDMFKTRHDTPVIAAQEPRILLRNEPEAAQQAVVVDVSPTRLLRTCMHTVAG